jgi:hypothetical protein
MRVEIDYIHKQMKGWIFKIRYAMPTELPGSGGTIILDAFATSRERGSLEHDASSCSSLVPRVWKIIKVVPLLRAHPCCLRHQCLLSDLLLGCSVATSLIQIDVEYKSSH